MVSTESNGLLLLTIMHFAHDQRRAIAYCEIDLHNELTLASGGGHKSWPLFIPVASTASPPTATLTLLAIKHIKRK